MANSTAAAPPLSVGTKLSYGIGQAGEGLKNGAFGVFLFFYYNQVLGLSGTYAGLAVGIALMFDALSDPLIGSISDNWRSPRGRRHPFMYAAALPLGIAFFLLFSPPALSEFGLFLWLLGFAVLTRAAMTLYHVPHISLGAELSRDYGERTTVVAYRQFFSTFGALAAIGIGFGLFFHDGGGGQPGQFRVEAYSPFAALLALFMAVTICWSAWGTQHRLPYLPQAQGEAERLTATGVVIRMGRELRQALGNRSFAWLFAGVLIVFTMVGVDSALNLHMNTFFWELSSGANFAFFVAAPLGVMIGAFFVGAMNRRFDKKACVLFGTGWWSLCQFTPIVLRLLGWFPENGTAELVVTLVTVKFLQGLGVVQALVTFSSMVADVVDEHELLTGRRQEGIFFASVSFSGKFTTGIGNVVGGIALDLIRWPRGPEVQTAADVPPDTLASLGVIYGPVVAGFAVVSIWCYAHYHLDRVRHGEIVEQLAARENGAKTAAAG